MEYICTIWNNYYNDSLRSGPMRRVSNEPRQVRKEAAVVMRSVCCGVPGLFLGMKKMKYFVSLACLRLWKQTLM